MQCGHELRRAQNLDPIPKAGAKRGCLFVRLCVLYSIDPAAAAAAAAAAANDTSWEDLLQLC